MSKKLKKQKKKLEKQQKKVKKTFDKNLDVCQEGNESRPLFKKIPGSPGQMSSFVVTLMACYAKIHWGEEAKAKDMFIMCKHIHEIVSQILGFSQEEFSAGMDEVNEWSLKEEQEYAEKMLNTPTNLSLEDSQVDLENFNFDEDI